MIEASEITRSNLPDLLRLKVADDQQHLVASNSVTIAQAHYRPHCWLRGLWSGEKAVGFLAMIDLRPDSLGVDEDARACFRHHPDGLEGLAIEAAVQWYDHIRRLTCR